MLRCRGACACGAVDWKLGFDVTGLHQDARHVVVVASSMAFNEKFDLAIVCNGALSKLSAQQCLPVRWIRGNWGTCAAIVESPGRYTQQTVWQWYHDSDNYFGVLPLGPDRASLFWNVRSPAQLRGQDFVAWQQPVSGFHPCLAGAVSSLRGFEDFRFSSFVEVRMSRWHTGRIVFIGDAAHATDPQLGMGANMALVDACVLASAVARRR